MTRRRRLYFAYGSNLNVEQMRWRCPTAKLVGPATLMGERLVFRGVADVETGRPTDHVPGALWSIDEAALEALDRYEGFPRLYDRETVTVLDREGRRHRAIVYRMTRQDHETLPHSSYLDTIIRGYRDVGILHERRELNRAIARAGHRLHDAGITHLVRQGKRMAPAPRHRTAGMTRATQLELGLEDAQDGGAR